MDGVCDMTSVVLLEQLKAFTEKIMSDMILPCPGSLPDAVA